jgi:signal transduction histidine kinase
MDLGRARDRFDSEPESARQLVTEAHEEAKAALAELRNLARGIHPAVLTDRGLDAALSAVITRCPVPVSLAVDVPIRPPASIESAAYFVVAEALTNVAKHANATRVDVSIVLQNNRLIVDIRDDGVGGAESSKGSGLSGLADRVNALGGWMRVLSPTGGPTSVIVEIPCGS